MERRLGKGLEALLQAQSANPDIQEIELGLISPNPFQPRQSVDPGGLEELRDSIREHGVLQPVIVRHLGDLYQLIAGERRWRAARLAGLERIPAMIRADVSDHDMLELALVENVQRRELNALERAEAFNSLMQQLGLTQEAVAAKVGLKRATVANHLRLLESPEDVRQAVARGTITMGHARALLGLASAALVTSTLREILQDGLSVRQVEERVRGHVRRAQASQAATEGNEAPAWVAAVERRLRDALATKVTVHAASERRGIISVFFYSPTDLDRLIDRMAPRATIS